MKKAFLYLCYSSFKRECCFPCLAHFFQVNGFLWDFLSSAKKRVWKKLLCLACHLPKAWKQSVLIPVPKTNNKTQTNHPYAQTTLFLLISVKNYFSVPLKTFWDLDYKIEYPFGAAFPSSTLACKIFFLLCTQLFGHYGWKPLKPCLLHEVFPN